jgi:hypothetical protein
VGGDVSRIGEFLSAVDVNEFSSNKAVELRVQRFQLVKQLLEIGLKRVRLVPASPVLPCIFITYIIIITIIIIVIVIVIIIIFIIIIIIIIIIVIIISPWELCTHSAD